MDFAVTVDHLYEFQAGTFLEQPQEPGIARARGREIGGNLQPHDRDTFAFSAFDAAVGGTRVHVNAIGCGAHRSEAAYETFSLVTAYDDETKTFNAVGRGHHLHRDDGAGLFLGMFEDISRICR